MRSYPWAVAAAVFVLTTVLLVVAAGDGVSVPSVIIGAIAAFVLCIGSAFAPITLGGPKPDVDEARYRRSVQLVTAAVVTVALVWIASMQPAIAAILGISAAIGVGAVLPRRSTAA